MLIVIKADRKKDKLEAIRHTQAAVKKYIAVNGVMPGRLTIHWEDDHMASVFSKGHSDTVGYVMGGK
jgi:hypothetical protein